MKRDTHHFCVVNIVTWLKMRNRREDGRDFIISIYLNDERIKQSKRSSAISTSVKRKWLSDKKRDRHKSCVVHVLKKMEVVLEDKNVLRRWIKV